MPDKKASIDILFHRDFSSIQLQKAMDETIFNCQMIELLYWQLSMCIYVYGGHKVNSRKMSMNLNFCTGSYTCFVKFTKPVYHKQTRHETTKICTCSRKDILGHVNSFQDNSRSIIFLIGPVTPSQYPPY